MSDREQPSGTPPPVNVEAAPVNRGLGADISTAQPHMNETPTLAWNSVGGAPRTLVGQTFGDFELTEELGRGGMGVVFKAYQKSLDRHVALKLLRGEHSSNPMLLKRFLEESRAAARLSHPNIVSVYQVGECFAGPFFVMEYIDGPSLEMFLKRTLPISSTVALLIKVAEAVQHAHEKGIIHRDLKPGNIMLHQSKRPVVMDFGIAKVMGKGMGMTQVGSVIGTPAYMPPEQAGDEPSKIGPHSDVYSLGAVLYTLLTGRVPFEESTVLKTILKVISATPPEPLRNLRPDAPLQLEKICMRCLEKEPKNRYQTARALADDLKRFRETLSGKVLTASPRTSLPTVVLVSPDGKQVRLSKPATVIGRHHDCDLVVKGSEISKRHCRIVLALDEVVVEDLGSVNGTTVNGKQIERSRLKDGDELDVGGHVFQVVVPGTETS